MTKTRDLADLGGGFIQAGTGAVQRTVESKLQDVVSVKDFGAEGDGTNDTAAFANALAASSTVYVPPGNYNIKELTVPAQKRLVGASVELCVLYTASGPADHVVSLGGGATLENVKVNGNLIASKGVKINGDYATIKSTSVQYCTYGFYNAGYDTATIADTKSNNNTYGIYSANRFINCLIDNHFSTGFDTYGVFLTCTDQEPQGVRIVNSAFFGNNYGIVFDKHSFSMQIVNCVIDGIVNTAIKFGTVGPLVGATDFLVSGCFISCVAPPPPGTATYGIHILPGNDHVVVSGNDIANCYHNVYVGASSTQRCVSLTLRDNLFNNNQGQSLFLDSVKGALIDGNVFSLAGAASDIATTHTFSGTQHKVIVSNNTFNKTGSVSPFLTDCINNINYITKARAVAAIPAGQTTVDVNHGMSVTPDKILLTPQGNVGNVWVSNIGSTQFRINCSSAPASNTVCSWQAIGD
jgi:hypothetical protein